MKLNFELLKVSFYLLKCVISRAISSQKKYNLIILLFVIAFSVLCGLSLNNLKFDYDFEALFPNENNELENYNNYRKTFEYDNEFVLLAIENKAGIFQKKFLLKIDSLSKTLEKTLNIRHVSSPTNLKVLSLNELVPFQKRVLHFADPSFYKQDSIDIYQSPFLVGSYFPLNAKSLSIFIKTEDGLSKSKSDVLAAEIEKALRAFNFDEIHFVGRIFAQNVYLVTLQKEFVLFLSLSFFVVILFLWISFRSIYGIVVPLVIVVISVWWTLGIMSLMGKPIDIMCSMLPTMIFIAGMSDVVHFFSKYFEEISKGTAKENIYKLILREVGFPTFLTLITTVVGFLSLLFSSIRPIREFGIYTAVGVSVAFILTYTLLPALLYFFTPKKLVSLHGSDNKTYGIMRRGLFWIFRNQKTILIVTSLLLVFSVLGIYKIKVNNILLEDLSEKVKIKKDFNFFDQYYSGVRPFELEIEVNVPGKKIWDYDVMQQIDKVEVFVKQNYSAGFLVSPAGLIKSIYKSTVLDTSDEFPAREDYEPIATQLKRNKKNKEVKRLVTPDGTKTRISAKIQDMGSIRVNELNTKLMQFIDKNIDKNVLTFKVTGAAHLVDRNNEYMVKNMLQGFLFSIIVIAVLTFFLHRSWRMVLVFIIPNFIPLIVIGGVMGFLGIELKAATSLVFSIAFGIATDDTIHFISRLKIELAYGKSLMYAFKRTYFETGKPILMTTFILMGGFMSLMVSDFQSVFYFGFLICITVIVAVLADIFLLPVLLFMIYKNEKPKIEE